MTASQTFLYKPSRTRAALLFNVRHVSDWFPIFSPAHFYHEKPIPLFSSDYYFGAVRPRWRYMDMLAVEDFSFFSEEENLDEWHSMDTPMSVYPATKGNGKSRLLRQLNEYPSSFPFKKGKYDIPKGYTMNGSFGFPPNGNSDVYHVDNDVYESFFDTPSSGVENSDERGDSDEETSVNSIDRGAKVIHNGNAFEDSPTSEEFSPEEAPKALETNEMIDSNEADWSASEPINITNLSQNSFQTKKTKRKSKLKKLNGSLNLEENQLHPITTPAIDSQLHDEIAGPGVEHTEKDGKHFFTFKILPVERNEIEVKRKHKKLSKMKKTGATLSIQDELLMRVNALKTTFEAQQIDILLEGEVMEILYERLVKLSGKCKDEIDLLNANFVEKSLLGPILPFMMKTNSLYLFNKLTFTNKEKEISACIEGADYNSMNYEEEENQDWN